MKTLVIGAALASALATATPTVALAQHGGHSRGGGASQGGAVSRGGGSSGGGASQGGAVSRGGDSSGGAVRGGGPSMGTAVPRGSYGGPYRGGPNHYYGGRHYYGSRYYYGGYYGWPYYGGALGLGFYYPWDGFSFGFGYGYPYGYPYYGYYGYPYGTYPYLAYPPPAAYEPADDSGNYVVPQGPNGSIRLQIEPKDAQVYADGYYVGVVADFSGRSDHLELTPGPHKIEVRSPGYETLAFDINVQSRRTLDYRGALVRQNP